MENPSSANNTDGHASHVRFMQQMLLGVGGATVFGLVGALGTKLLALGAGLWPVAGLVALAAVGIGCIYLGTKFWTESIRLDQEAQAQKISKATGLARSRTIAQEPATPAPGAQKVASAPPGMDSLAAAEEKNIPELPGKLVNDGVAFERIQAAEKAAPTLH